MKKFESLEELRKDIDEIDLTILDLIQKRKDLVTEVVKLKKRDQIVDQKRIESILSNIRKKSLKNKIDPRITNRIWKNMIWSYIDYERRNFKKK